MQKTDTEYRFLYGKEKRRTTGCDAAAPEGDS
jgi:hypothetical protein